MPDLSLNPYPAALDRVRATIRKHWTRAALHGVHFADKHSRLDTLYRIQDPWGMESEAQRFRFTETNRLIERHFGRVGTLLEVGCGEGHQSQELRRVCDRLVGIDVSARALERARSRCPQGIFSVGDIFAPGLLKDGRFDLIVACEVLYYMKDVPSALARLGTLGRICLVTYYRRPAEELDPHVLSIPGVESTTVQHGDSSWTVAWWRGAS